MRIVLIGRRGDRARLRAELDNTRIEVVGEFDTLAGARASAPQIDAFLLADTGPGSDVQPAQGDEWIEEPLTPREVEVLELLADGLSNKSIAGRLGISDQTVKFHVASITGKLGASNRTDAVRRALRRGLISL